MIGRLLLAGGAVLLFLTALIHAAGRPMVSGWVESLLQFQAAAICLVWITDSWDWAVTALVWAIAAWKGGRGWLGASAVLCLLPFGMFVGIMGIDPTFFGAWMLIGSVALAASGIALSWRATPTGL